MLDGVALLSSLYRKGVNIWEDNGQLRYHALPGVLLSDELSELCRLTNEILRILRLPKWSLHSPIQPREYGSYVPLTAIQLAMWNWKQTLPNAPNCVTSVRVNGVLDTSLLRRCIHAVVLRHESLRTRIVAVNGIPRQQVMEDLQYSFQTVDLSHVPQEASENEVKQLGQEFVQQTVDVSLGPMFRAKLFRIADTEHVLFCATDHIVSDGASKRIVDREIWTLYDRSQRGLDPLLNDVLVQFPDYAIWQERTHHDWLKEHEAYWRDHLRDAPSLRLPIDNSSRRIETSDITVQRFPFGEEMTKGLRELAKRERTMLSTVVLSAYILAMSCWCNQKDVVVRVVLDGRVRPELEQMIGYIATPLMLRVQVIDSECLLQLLKRTENEFYTACDHYDYFRVQSLIPDCHTEVFNWMPDSVGCSAVWQWAEQIESISVRPYPFVQILRFNFFPLFYYTNTDIVLTVQYCKECISADAVENFSKYVLAFTRALARDPHSSIALVAAQEP